MLAKEFLTRWNTKAIIHAKARDLERIKALPRYPRRVLIDPRCLAVGDVLTDQGTSVAPVFSPPGTAGTVVSGGLGGVTLDSSLLQTRRMAYDILGGRVFVMAKASKDMTINTNHPQFGFPVTTGGPSGTTGADPNDAAFGDGIEVTTSIGSGGGYVLSLPSGLAGWYRRFFPYAAWWIKTGSTLANTRIWPVLCSGAPTSDTPAISCIGFRYSSTIGANWFWMVGDGTVNGTDLGVAVATSTRYLLEAVTIANGTIDFYINGVLRANSGATNLPVTTTALSGANGLYVNSIATNAAICAIGWIYASQN